MPLHEQLQKIEAHLLGISERTREIDLVVFDADDTTWHVVGPRGERMIASSCFPPYKPIFDKKRRGVEGESWREPEPYLIDFPGEGREGWGQRRTRQTQLQPPPKKKPKSMRKEDYREWKRWWKEQQQLGIASDVGSREQQRIMREYKQRKKLTAGGLVRGPARRPSRPRHREGLRGAKPAGPGKCHIWLRKGMDETVYQLREKGIPMGMASANNPKPVNKAMEALGLAEDFLLIEAGWDPKSKMVKRIMNEAGIRDPCKVMFVDDNPGFRMTVAKLSRRKRCPLLVDPLRLESMVEILEMIE